jgi:hypothetical protein
MPRPFAVNLTSTLYRSPSINVSGSTSIGVTIALNTDENGARGNASHTWSSAVVELKWSLEDAPHDAGWFSYLTAVTFTGSVQSRQNIPVSGAKFVRLQTTTAESGTDPLAYCTVVTNRGVV